MKRIHLIWISLALPLLALAQANYEDVVVIINQNDDNSMEIGQYFAAERNIPANNLIYIDCPSVEIIDSTGFMDIRFQIEDKLVSQGLETKTNYLVTTKGIPFNVRKAEDCQGVIGIYECSSFDSEISLIFSEWSDQILGSGFGLVNPYYEADEYYDRSKFGIFLVTRLDAYTVGDVKTLIDRSGPGQEVAKSSSQVIIDFSSVMSSAEKELFTDFVQPTIDLLLLKDWTVTFDPEDELLTGQSDVLGYFNINYQPSNKVLDFDWLNGSIAEIMLSTGNLTFYKEQNVFNELSVPDLIEEGATGASTYVNPLFFSQLIQLHLLYDRYLDEEVNPSYNLAESYFMAMPRLSNQYLVIGDPKTSLRIQQSNTAEKEGRKGITLYPNPADDQLTLSFYAGVPGQYSIMIRDVNGKELSATEAFHNKGVVSYREDISFLPQGIYMVTLSGPGQEVRSMKFIKAGR